MTTDAAAAALERARAFTFDDDMTTMEFECPSCMEFVEIQDGHVYDYSRRTGNGTIEGVPIGHTPVTVADLLDALAAHECRG